MRRWLGSLERTLARSNLLWGLVVAGVALRLVIVVGAEHRLDADESTVGVMALDILQGRALPLFFYGASYNGGGALEAYLGALAFAIVGPSALALKLCLLGLWAAAALLFADLSRRVLEPERALVAVLFFSVATPFFLEWSIKARGGYAETVLFSVVLLWLAAPPPFLKKRRFWQCLIFGVTSGIGWWASAMLLPMVACAGIWLVLCCERDERRGTASWLVASLALGFAPLLLLKRHLQQPIFESLGAGVAPLSLAHLRLSAEFVLGPPWPLLLAGLSVAGVRLLLAPRPATLGQVALVHTLLYLAAYWVSGLRYLPIPPSRVLYALYPGISVLLAHAIDLSPATISVRRGVAAIALLAWLSAVAAPIAVWIASGQPRETGSWRGSWSLTDGTGLYQRLAREGVELAYASYWTTWSLQFAARSARYRDPAAARLTATWDTRSPIRRPQVDAAIVLHEGTKLLRVVEHRLQAARISHRRVEWDGFVILLPDDVFRLRAASALPAILDSADWRVLSSPTDGFN